METNMAVNDPDILYPDSLLEYLDGIRYPASKQDLLRYAREHDAPEDVLNDLNRLPDERFDEWMEITDALGEGR
jgi:hypothetical protein